MSGITKRQTHRMTRLLKELERTVFDLGEHLRQNDDYDAHESFYWELVVDHLARVDEQLAVLRSLAKNAWNETGGTK